MGEPIGQSKTPTRIGSDFKLVLIVGWLLTLLFLAAASGVALLVSSPNSMQTRVIETCLDLAKFGAGAIFGLLGGRSTKR